MYGVTEVQPSPTKDLDNRFTTAATIMSRHRSGHDWNSLDSAYHPQLKTTVSTLKVRTLIGWKRW